MMETQSVMRDKIVHCDMPGQRALDLRPHGVDCIPVLGLSDFRMKNPRAGLHVHPGCVEICLCVRGNLTFETDEADYPFLPGSIFVSTDSQPHRLRNSPKGLKLYRILFAPPKRGRTILSLTQAETKWLVQSLTHLPKRLFKATPKAKSAFESLFAIYDTERIAAVKSVKMKSAALELLIAVINAARLLPRKPPEAIADIMKRMREHPEMDYPIEDLARENSISLSGFSEAFKLVAGLPPHAYLIDCRIKKAQNLLAGGKSSVKAVSDLLKFSSPQHFATTFRKITGCTPSAWSKQA